MTESEFKRPHVFSPPAQGNRNRQL